MKPNDSISEIRSRWWQFSLRSYLLTITVIGVIFAIITLISNVWWSEQLQTISARLDSSGTVMWGDNFVSVSAMQSELIRSVKLLHAHGFKARLLIECYSDANDDDAEMLKTVGRKAGFDVVETARLAWPSPAHNHIAQ
jgi:hypothetical protein